MNRRQALLSLCAVSLVAQTHAAESAKTESPLIKVHKTSTCGCCKLWVQHLQKAGFAVDSRDHDDLTPIKERLGVPARLMSCHTAEVDGYFLEGHVPADDVKRLLRDRPAAKGLTVPGMPLGSPGMEVASGQVQPYDVLLVTNDGNSTVFASHGK